MDCKTVNNVAAATGLIVTPASADLHDAKTFTLNDGLPGHTAVVFEFDTKGDGVGTGHVPITFTGAENAQQTAALIETAINTQLTNLRITAGTPSGGILPLTHDVATGLGNIAITENETASDFAVFGMSGGGGADCSAGVGCTSDNDCTSLSCNTSTNQCN
jgi:hypothetical protein